MAIKRLFGCSAHPECMNPYPSASVLIALGGNALLARGEPASAAAQRAAIARAADAIAPLLGRRNVIITHGNGPQVGLLAAQSGDSGWPLDVLGAESAGMIGYVIEQELANRAPGRLFATLVNQTVVDADDPAFLTPTKPIGPIYANAGELRARGWSVVADSGGWRRAVPSPAPISVRHVAAIKALLAADVTVIGLGGGGVPVTLDAAGKARGVEAVIDKDAASALLALELGIDMLVLLTDVAGVMAHYGKPQERLIDRASAEALEAMSFAPGTMGPKVAAAIAMARAGKWTMIGSLNDLPAILRGTAGTWVLPDAQGCTA